MSGSVPTASVLLSQYLSSKGLPLTADNARRALAANEQNPGTIPGLRSNGPGGAVDPGPPVPIKAGANPPAPSPAPGNGLPPPSPPPPGPPATGGSNMPLDRTKMATAMPPPPSTQGMPPDALDPSRNMPAGVGNGPPQLPTAQAQAPVPPAMPTGQMVGSPPAPGGGTSPLQPSANNGGGPDVSSLVDAILGGGGAGVLAGMYGQRQGSSGVGEPPPFIQPTGAAEVNKAPMEIEAPGTTVPAISGRETGSAASAIEKPSGSNGPENAAETKGIPQSAMDKAMDIEPVSPAKVAQAAKEAGPTSPVVSGVRARSASQQATTAATKGVTAGPIDFDKAMGIADSLKRFKGLVR